MSVISGGKEVVQRLAEKMFELYHSKSAWNKETEITDEEKQTILDILACVGWKGADIVVDRVYRSPPDYVPFPQNQDQIAVNLTCPFKVVLGKDNLKATEWLEGIFKDLYRGNIHSISREELVYNIFSKMVGDAPITPIVLTKEGDVLVDGFLDGLSDKPQRDRNKLEPQCGVHRVCGGKMKIIQSSADKKVIVCKKCYLRVYIPLTVNTYGELREFLEGESDD